MLVRSTATHTNTQSATMEESFFFLSLSLCFSSEISLPASFSLRCTHTLAADSQHASRHFILSRSFCAPKSDSISGLWILWTSVGAEITLQVQRQQISVFCSEPVNLPAFHSSCSSLQLLFRPICHHLSFFCAFTSHIAGKTSYYFDIGSH